MHHADSARWRHPHQFAADTSMAESRTRIVIGITVVMMVVEIAAGTAFNSMALLADGWHMGTHVAAFVIAALAYYFSRRHAEDTRYTFGTGKIGVLGGFASAIILSIIALLMVSESVHRIIVPTPIQLNEAIGVAALGLVVNLVCAFLLKGDHHHHHGHGAGHAHDHHHHGSDLNSRAAYVHVLADAFTSVSAIVALLVGKYLGWLWLDPMMGIVGGVVVALWSIRLLRDTSDILLDRTPVSTDLPDEIRGAVEADGDSVVTDLHLWQVAEGKFAAIVSIVGHEPKDAEAYRALFREHEELVHVTVEVQHCHDHETAAASPPRT